MDSALMIECFSFVKEYKSYLIEGKTISPFSVVDCDPQSILNVAKEKQVKSIILWGPKDFCKGLEKQIKEKDVDNFKIVCK